MFSLPPGANFSLAARRRVSETSQTATISVFSALAARPEAGDANTLVGAEDTAVGGGRPGGGGGQKITTLHHGCTPAGALPVCPIGHMLALVQRPGINWTGRVPRFRPKIGVDRRLSAADELFSRAFALGRHVSLAADERRGTPINWIR